MTRKQFDNHRARLHADTTWLVGSDFVRGTAIFWARDGKVGALVRDLNGYGFQCVGVEARDFGGGPYDCRVKFK